MKRSLCLALTIILAFTFRGVSTYAEEKIPVVNVEIGDEVPISEEDEPTEETPTGEDELTEETPTNEDELTEEIPTNEDEPTKETPIDEEDLTAEIPTDEDEPTEESPTSEDEPTEESPTGEDEPTEESPTSEDEPTEEFPTGEDEPIEETPIVEVDLELEKKMEIIDIPTISIETDTIYSVIVPDNLDFTIDPFEMEGRGQIYSDVFQFVNLGMNDVILRLSDIRLTVTNPYDFAEMPYASNDICIQLDLGDWYGSVQITDYDITSVDLLLPADGRVVPMSISGILNSSTDIDWFSTGVKIDVTYQLIGIDIESTIEEVSVVEVIKEEAEDEVPQDDAYSDGDTNFDATEIDTDNDSDNTEAEIDISDEDETIMETEANNEQKEQEEEHNEQPTE